MNSQTGTTQRARSRMWQRLRALPVNHVRAPQRDGLLRRRHKLLGRIKTAVQSTLDSNIAIYIRLRGQRCERHCRARARSVTTSSSRSTYVQAHRACLLRPAASPVTVKAVLVDTQTTLVTVLEVFLLPDPASHAGSPPNTPFKENQIPT